MSQRLLLIEDTVTLQLIYSANLKNAGYDVDVASTGTEGLELFQTLNNPVVIMDLFLPDMDGVEVIRRFVQRSPQAKIIVITSNGSISRAVEAMRAGAFDFLLKPFSDERLLSAVSSALESFDSRPEISLDAGSFYGFVGRGPIMQEMYRKIMRIAPSTAPVFLVGELGVGKETCANAIHNHLGDKTRPFVKYSGEGLTPDVQDSTLLGSLGDIGSELGAEGKGALQKACGGTFYINEVSELDPVVQSKLAAFMRKASQNEQYTDNSGNPFPRIICSTSIDPYQLLEARKIREDLFYQLHILTVNVPPLRELGSDIIFIAETILERLSRVEQKHFTGLSNEVSEAFVGHDWPGNISQMENLLHKIVASYDSDLVEIQMLPVGFAPTDKKHIGNGLERRSGGLADERMSNAIFQLVGLNLDELERNFIEATIQSHDGSIPKAADMLGVAPSTIYRKRSKH